MESTVLLDGEHIRAMGALCTFRKENEEIRWCILDCANAWKFLVVNGRLVIGPINTHAKLYAVHILWDQPSEEAKKKVPTVANEQMGGRNDSVTGAGMIGTDGKVTGWKSEGFRIETPESMRAEIEVEIARLYQTGGLSP